MLVTSCAHRQLRWWHIDEGESEERSRTDADNRVTSWRSSQPRNLFGFIPLDSHPNSISPFLRPGKPRSPRKRREEVVFLPHLKLTACSPLRGQETLLHGGQPRATSPHQSQGRGQSSMRQWGQGSQSLNTEIPKRCILRGDSSLGDHTEKPIPAPLT